ncbi:MAG: hypothetical protein JO020_13320 [Chloroflexi bacterium]|nr:hypothetical protein [Chloroflexota bacterium]MBV9131586.1 hypothetical protein [Chloroflexota bacterium]MBV9895142.1 hypothetical protein [Chloroflexota bacterium]
MRATLNWRGPVYGLRPVCSASIWYIGFPTAPPAAGAVAAEGDGAATAAGEAAGAGDAAGLAAGEAAAAGGTLAGETDATGWMAGGDVGFGAGGFVTVIGWGGLPQATSRVVPRNAMPLRQRPNT